MLLVELWLLGGQSTVLNTSLCTDIEIDSLHYYINEKDSDNNIQFANGSTLFTYNLCKQVEVYCSYQNTVLVASMVGVDPTT